MQKNNSGSADSATVWPFVHAVPTVAHIGIAIPICLGRMVGTSEPTPYCSHRRAVICLLCNVANVVVVTGPCCARNSRDSRRCNPDATRSKSRLSTALHCSPLLADSAPLFIRRSLPALSLRTSEPRSSRRTAPRSLGSKSPHVSQQQTKQDGL